VDARRHLLQLLGTNRAIAFTGAGVSVYAGYPLWSALIQRLGDAVRAKTRGEVDPDVVIHNNIDLLHCAQRLGVYLGQDFAEFVRAEFGPNGIPPHNVLYKIVSLPFKHFLTLNFETSCELAHRALQKPCGTISITDRRELVNFLRQMELPDYVRQVVHLHGVYTDPVDQIALTERGFGQLYRDPVFQNVLWMLAASKPLVFLGFGFEDTDFNQALRTTARDVRENGLLHSAVIGIRPEEDGAQLRYRFNDTYLIEPVFYEIDVHAHGLDGHRGFVELVNGISAALGLPERHLNNEGQAQAGIPPAAPNPDDLNRAEQLGNALLERIDPEGNDVQG
jgi:hypothetical protein